MVRDISSFSSHESDALPLCHAACLSSSSLIFSSIESSQETRLECAQLTGNSVSGRKGLQLGQAHGAGFYHGEDPCVILGSSRAEGYQCKIVRPDNSERDTRYFGSLCFLHCLFGKRAESRNELHGPFADAYSLSFRLKTSGSAVRRDRHRYVRVHRRHSFRVSHLGHRAEDGIVSDNPCGHHVPKKLGDLLHHIACRATPRSRHKAAIAVF